MSIWIDADACPVVIREIIYKAAHRTQVTAYFVSNHYIRLPKSPYIKAMQVASGFDVADNEIARRVEAGDLVITSDIPLASEVIDKNAEALNTRGELFTVENIKSRLNIRDFMDTMRSSGYQTGGSPALSQTDKQNFANHLDRYLTKLNKK